MSSQVPDCPKSACGASRSDPVAGCQTAGSSPASNFRGNAGPRKVAGVDYQHYWVSEAAGKVICLVEAPDRDAAIAVHREAHGPIAPSLYAVRQGA